MKTKLTLNIDDKIVAGAKQVSAKRKTSLSSLVEEYLDRISKSNSHKKTGNLNLRFWKESGNTQRMQNLLPRF